MNKRLGFSLIELLLTLALLSILLLIIVPKTNIFTNYHIKIELNTLKRDLYAARSKAVSEGTTYYFHVPDGGDKYYFIGKDSKITRSVILSKIRILTSGNNPFSFNSLGNVTRSTTINIRDAEGENYQLKVGVATGKISLVKTKD